MSKKQKGKLKNVVDWVCLNLFIFASILLNFTYTIFLQDVMSVCANQFVKIMDSIGFEVHFVRFLHMTLFDQSSIVQDKETLSELGDKAGYDGLMFAFIILPLFYSAMHFYTAPFRRRYTGTIQVVICPAALIPLFFWQNIDICFLAALVLMMNLYIAWYHIDAADEFRSESDDDDSEEVEMQVDESSWMESFSGMFSSVASGFDMTGMAMMNGANQVKEKPPRGSY